MGLIQYLLTEGKKNVIVNKIGLPEHLAEYCIKYFDKKFVLYWASAISNAIMDFKAGSKLKEPDYSYESFVSNFNFQALRTLEVFLKQPNLPSLDKKTLNKFKQKAEFPSEHFNRARNYNDMYVTIRDYAESTNQNFQNDDFEEVHRQAVEWHETKEASGKSIELEGDAEVIHTFDDGYYWVDNHDNDCEVEGDAMGHCGRTSADTILSLRDPSGEPHISVAFDYDGTYTQAKGKQNKKPVRKYHPYMHWLFTNDGKYQIKKYSGEYQTGEDFKVDDLPDDLKDEVLTKYPSIDPVHRLRKVMDDDSLTGKQKYDKFVEMDREDDIFGGDLENIKFDESDDTLIVVENADPVDYAKKDDRTFEWSMEVIRGEHFLDFFDGIDSEFYLDMLDTDKYSYDSKEVQTLLGHAKEEDEDLYNEKVDEFLLIEYDEIEEGDDIEELLNESLIEFLKFLYESDKFDEFNTTLDNISRWSMESQAFDEIAKDTLSFIIDTPLENDFSETDLEWEWVYENKYDLIHTNENPVNIKMHFYKLIGLLEDNIERFESEYIEDVIRPFNFTDRMSQPYNGYPKYGIDKETYNTIFADGVYN